MIVVGRVSTLRRVPREASFVQVRECAPNDECVVVVDCEFRRGNGGNGDVPPCERTLCLPPNRIPSILLIDRGVDDLLFGDGGNGLNDASSSAITLGTNDLESGSGTNDLESGSSTSRYDPARECSVSAADDRREWLELMNDDPGDASERVMNVAARGYLLLGVVRGGENGGAGREERMLLDLMDEARRCADRRRPVSVAITCCFLIADDDPRIPTVA
jgi:hypothetical protein